MNISIDNKKIDGKFSFIISWRKYSEVVDVNAYYFHQENSFILNAGILQDRFFNPDRPK